MSERPEFELLDGDVEKQWSSLQNFDLYQSIGFQTSPRIVLVVSYRVDLDMDEYLYKIVIEINTTRDVSLLCH